MKYGISSKISLAILALPLIASAQVKKTVSSCVEEKLSLFSEFIPLKFEKSASTVGLDEVRPVKATIEKFITSDPDLIITDVSVTASSSKTPYLSRAGKKIVIDPRSHERNMSLAQDRAIFASKMLEGIKKTRPSLAKVNFTSNAVSAGPEFDRLDLNTRMVTNMSPNYKKRVEDLYEQNKEMYEAQGLIKSADELLDQSKYTTLYEVKFKPFQGFKIKISGYHKKKMKCSEPAKKPRGSSGSRAKGE